MKFFETIHMDEDLSESKDEVRRKIGLWLQKCCWDTFSFFNSGLM